jgi:hypothetical protein
VEIIISTFTLAPKKDGPIPVGYFVRDLPFNHIFSVFFLALGLFLGFSFLDLLSSQMTKRLLIAFLRPPNDGTSAAAHLHPTLILAENAKPHF